MDKIKEVSYSWYDHMLIRKYPKVMKLVEDSINEHDYDTFKFLQKALNSMTQYEYEGKTYNLEYLPDYVCVELEDESVEFRKITKSLFNKIIFSEYECG